MKASARVDDSEGRRRRWKRRAPRRQALYELIVVKAVPVSSTATAEAVKLTENIFRSVNIALVNELKVIYDAMGIDVWEVIEARQDQAIRLHAVLSRARARRALHSDRSLLSDVESP